MTGIESFLFTLTLDPSMTWLLLPTSKMRFTALSSVNSTKPYPLLPPTPLLCSGTSAYDICP